jgi:hypothetical protein
MLTNLLQKPEVQKMLTAHPEIGRILEDPRAVREKIAELRSYREVSTAKK